MRTVCSTQTSCALASLHFSTYQTDPLFPIPSHRPAAPHLTLSPGGVSSEGEARGGSCCMRGSSLMSKAPRQVANTPWRSYGRGRSNTGMGYGERSIAALFRHTLIIQEVHIASASC